ncbi:MAG: phosphatase PAP2 family protein [Bacteroidales bacterium]|nr:phosphatase PAP2 family protein [Bacteroidales bacterium]
MARWLIILFLISGFQQKVAAQDSLGDQIPNDYRLNLDYMKSYGPAALHVVKAPANFDTKDWIVTGSVLAGLTILYFNDLAVYEKFQSISSAQGQSFRWTEIFGNGVVALPSLAAIFIYGSVKNIDHSRNVALTGLQAFVFGAEGAFLLKHLTHRVRPDMELAPNQWYGPFRRFDADAFPSGHAMRAFVVATTLAGMYDDKPWLGAGFYALASLTAYGRLVSGDHWPSDVLAGAALGYFIGRGVVHFNKSNSKRKAKFIPFSGQGGFGLVMKF